MGHVVDRNDRPYTVGRARLNPSQVAAMREAYHRAEPFLSTQKGTRQPDEAELKKAILSVFLPDEEVAKLDVSNISAEEVRKLVTDRVRGSGSESSAGMQVPQAPRPSQNGNGGANGAESCMEAVVPLSEVKVRLAEGWTWVAALGSVDAILRRPQ